MCVHIAAITRLPFISHECSWDEISYSFQDYDGTNGTISFDVQNNVIVGVFIKRSSRRIAEYPDMIALDFFKDANKNVRELARKEALQYMLLNFEQKRGNFFSVKRPDILVPVVTTVCWNEGDHIYSPDNEADFLENGGEYINQICKPRDKLLEYLIDDYELTDGELKFAEQLFSSKRKGISEIKKELYSSIVDTKAEGYEEFILVLSNFGIKIASDT
jgi:hypothetical protein